jgi:hypothetical protein
MLQVESASLTGSSGDTWAIISDYFSRLSGISKFHSNKQFRLGTNGKERERYDEPTLASRLQKSHDSLAIFRFHSS